MYLAVRIHKDTINVSSEYKLKHHNKMKNSELIKKLQILLEKHGDNEIAFSVRDHYSRYGESATLNLKVGDTDKLGLDWYGCFTNNGRTTLELHLDQNHENKNPKITFRS